MGRTGRPAIASGSFLQLLLQRLDLGFVLFDLGFTGVDLFLQVFRFFLGHDGLLLVIRFRLKANFIVIGVGGKARRMAKPQATPPTANWSSTATAAATSLQTHCPPCGSPPATATRLPLRRRTVAPAQYR